MIRLRSSPNSSEASCDSRARIQLALPRSVLISPLWAIIRNGCASVQLGKVLVLKRECTSARRLAQPRVAQVGEVARQLRRREHALVDERARREARDRDLGPGLALDQAPDHVQLALERVLVGDLIGGRDQHLADVRLRGPRGVAGVAIVGRDVAPPDHALPLGLDGLLDQLLELARGARARSAGSTTPTA